jgi:hypothetical protein
MQPTHNGLPACSLELSVPTHIPWVLVAYQQNEAAHITKHYLCKHLYVLFCKKKLCKCQWDRHRNTWTHLINTLQYLPWLWRRCNYVMLLERHTRRDIYSLSWQYNETRDRFFQILRLLYFKDDTTVQRRQIKRLIMGNENCMWQTTLCICWILQTVHQSIQL